jgi:hypothetical protein
MTEPTWWEATLADPRYPPAARRAARAARLAARLGRALSPREALELYWRSYNPTTRPKVSWVRNNPRTP